MYRKKIGFLFAAMLFLSGCNVSGCNRGENKSEEMPANTTAATTSVTEITTTTTETTTTTKPIPQGMNPLTGEIGMREEAAGKRPVAVMVNNLKKALPQYGIAAADIIYEMPVEAGITRLMAVYADYGNVPNICSVRSCRYYYPILAYGMDAIYCHWGMDQTIAKETLERLGIDRLDGGGNGWKVCFFRDSDRVGKYASEHTGYLDGSKLPDAIAQYGFRTDTETKKAFSFRDQSTIVPEGDPCSYAVLHFSEAYWSTFEYDEKTKTYLKKHCKNPHMDSGTNTQLAFRNIFILQTDISLREDNYLVDIGLGSGGGFYISAGAIQPISWVKSEESAPIKIYGGDGQEIWVNAGKSYIGLIDYDRRLEFSE